jgi:hypothetical protein
VDREQDLPAPEPKKNYRLLSKAFNVAPYRHELGGHAVREVLHPLQTQFAGIVRSVCFSHVFEATQPIDLPHRMIIHV